MIEVEPLRLQLAGVAGRLHDRLRVTLALDVRSPHTVRELDRVVAEWADHTAHEIVHAINTSDDHTLAQHVIDIGYLVGRSNDEPAWWRTPLGRVCALSLGHTDDIEHVTYATAAAMLGVSRGTVGTLVERGTLDRHPDGGVVKASVLRRIATVNSN